MQKWSKFIPLATAACFLLAAGIWIAPLSSNSPHSAIMQTQGHSLSPSADKGIISQPEMANAPGRGAPSGTAKIEKTVNKPLPEKKQEEVAWGKYIASVLIALLGVFLCISWLAWRRRWDRLYNVDVG